MKKTPHIWKLQHLIDVTQSVSMLVKEEWVPVRPITISDIRTRMKAAWLVFTGKADAVVWPEGQ